ncbi:hypothetical protein K2173_015416 [Erythroxylum novogranatense]|uniref:Stigma-specific Stig1 family protein n=1 Tax=Erythroxylum novogranatense TaxID=1862640 RepID=A0AAV8SSS4_9ROSI|nr:hypothetical protein K2173_015416 [Erythroxylum novogranatense]
MKLLKLLCIVVIAVIALLMSKSSALPFTEVAEPADDDTDVNGVGRASHLGSSENEVVGRILAQRKPMKRRRSLTCNKFPRICHAKGSPGPDCCKKKCVNVLGDRMNCGACGKKCKYNEMCCNGKCVNPSFSRSHCGGCHNRCQNGGFCAFGLCNYA